MAGLLQGAPARVLAPLCIARLGFPDRLSFLSQPRPAVYGVHFPNSHVCPSKLILTTYRFAWSYETPYARYPQDCLVFPVFPLDIRAMNASHPGAVGIPPITGIIGLHLTTLQSKSLFRHGRLHFRGCIQPDVSKNTFRNLVWHVQDAFPLH